MKTLTRLMAITAVIGAFVDPAHALRDREIKHYKTAAELEAVTPSLDMTIAVARDTGQAYYYSAADSKWSPLPKTYSTNALLRADTGLEEGTVAYAADSNTSYLRSGSTWVPLDPRSPEVAITFDEGASKGLATMQPDYTASDRAEISTSLVSLTNWAVFDSGVTVAYAALADTGQTLDLAMAAGGLDISGDDTDNDGYELVIGYPGTSGRPFIIGTDPAFQFCASVDITDVSDTDEFAVGFRRAEPINPVLDNYLDAAYIGINASAATAAIKVDNILNNGANDPTDTTDTWADAAEKELCTYVSAAGVVTWTINGEAPSTTDAFTFDDGDPVVPFIRFLHSAANATVVTVVDMEARYQ